MKLPCCKNAHFVMLPFVYGGCLIMQQCGDKSDSIVPDMGLARWVANTQLFVTLDTNHLGYVSYWQQYIETHV